MKDIKETRFRSISLLILLNEFIWRLVLFNKHINKCVWILKQ